MCQKHEHVCVWTRNQCLRTTGRQREWLTDKMQQREWDGKRSIMNSLTTQCAKSSSYQRLRGSSTAETWACLQYVRTFRWGLGASLPAFIPQLSLRCCGKVWLFSFSCHTSQVCSCGLSHTALSVGYHTPPGFYRTKKVQGNKNGTLTDNNMHFYYSDSKGLYFNIFNKRQKLYLWK